MMGFNHALVGGLIGTVLPLPVAIPVALASHFILDSLPHYGIPNNFRDIPRFWKVLFTVDALATLALIWVPLSRQHYGVLACGFAAVVPDFVWVAQVVKTKSFTLSRHENWFTRWHAKIQHFERPWGVYIELPFAVVLFPLVLKLV
jgi:hypothetical protein